MKRLLPLLLLWLCACASLHGVAYKPHSALALSVHEQTPLFSRADTLSPYTRELLPNGTVYSIGSTGPFDIIRYEGRRYFVWAAHFSLLRRTGGYAPMPVYTGSADHSLLVGPRGGQYYINGNGNKTYVTPQSTIYNNTIYTGPRGGQYYINGNGRKTYIKH